MKNHRWWRLSLYLLFAAYCVLSTGNANAAPVPPAPADDREAAAADILTEEMSAHGFSQSVYLTEDGSLAVRLPSDAPPEAITAATAAVSNVSLSQYSQRDFALFDERITELSVAHPGIGFTTMYSGVEDELQLWLPDGADDLLVADASAAMADYVIAGTVSGHLTTRNDDTNPFFAGARIKKSTNTNSWCTGGISARTSTGTQVFLTAGHCGAVNSAWVSASGASGSVGTTTKRASGFAVSSSGVAVADASYITGKSYSAYVFNGTTGTSTSAKKVSGSGALGVGVVYCFSGASTYWTCEHKLEGTINETANGTTTTYSYFNGSLVAAGDSGGSIVRNFTDNVTICGMINGYLTFTPTSGSPYKRSYGMSWGTASSLLGVLTLAMY